MAIKQMASIKFPTGCIMQRNWDGTTIAVYGRYGLDYIRWKGSNRAFIKIIAMPGKPIIKALEELK